MPATPPTRLRARLRTRLGAVGSAALLGGGLVAELGWALLASTLLGVGQRPASGAEWPWLGGAVLLGLACGLAAWLADPAGGS